jgi:hypothetical protein
MLSKQLTRLGQAPTHRGFAAADDRGNLRGGKTFEIPEHEDRSIQDRDALQDELNFLRQLCAKPGVWIGQVERSAAVAESGPVVPERPVD